MAKRRTQRDVVRDLYSRFGDDRARIYAGVEKAVRRGEFRRDSNAANQSLQFYVGFLLDDGKRKGWIYGR